MTLNIFNIFLFKFNDNSLLSICIDHTCTYALKCDVHLYVCMYVRKNVCMYFSHLNIVTTLVTYCVRTELQPFKFLL